MRAAHIVSQTYSMSLKRYCLWDYRVRPIVSSNNIIFGGIVSEEKFNEWKNKQGRSKVCRYLLYLLYLWYFVTPLFYNICKADVNSCTTFCNKNMKYKKKGLWIWPLECPTSQWAIIRWIVSYLSVGDNKMNCVPPLSGR